MKCSKLAVYEIVAYINYITNILVNYIYIYI